MGYQAEVFQLIIGHAVGMNKVADIDQVSFKQLIESLGRVSAELQGEIGHFLSAANVWGMKPCVRSS